MGWRLAGHRWLIFKFWEYGLVAQFQKKKRRGYCLGGDLSTKKIPEAASRFRNFCDYENKYKN
jgi:hypothetical protein